jgi:hypothetical protein
VHIDRFKDGLLVVPISLSRFGSRAPSPRYSRIAAAEVSEIRKNSMRCEENCPAASGALILPGATALVFAEGLASILGLHLIDYFLEG